MQARPSRVSRHRSRRHLDGRNALGRRIAELSAAALAALAAAAAAARAGCTWRRCAHPAQICMMSPIQLSCLSPDRVEHACEEPTCTGAHSLTSCTHGLRGGRPLEVVHCKHERRWHERRCFGRDDVAETRRTPRAGTSVRSGSDRSARNRTQPCGRPRAAVGALCATQQPRSCRRERAPFHARARLRRDSRASSRQSARLGTLAAPAPRLRASNELKGEQRRVRN